MEIHVRVTAILVKDNKFLVIKRAQKDEFGKKTWTLPGGRVEFGENLSDAIRREIKEETCLETNAIKPISTWSGVRDGLWAVGICFLCRYEQGKVKLNEEHDDFLFIEFKDLEKADVEDWIKENARKALEEL